MSFHNTSYHDTKVSAVKMATATRTKPVAEPVGLKARHTARSQCLVVSTDPKRRGMFRQAALAAGWNAMDFVDANRAWTEAQRSMFQLALVDLHDAGAEPPGYRELAECLAPQSDLLLAVLGDDSHPSQEIWARQLGVWLYLPGVSLDDDLTTVCSEARQVSKRIEDRVRTPRPTSRRIDKRRRTKTI